MLAHLAGRRRLQLQNLRNRPRLRTWRTRTKEALQHPEKHGVAPPALRSALLEWAEGSLPEESHRAVGRIEAARAALLEDQRPLNSRQTVAECAWAGSNPSAIGRLLYSIARHSNSTLSLELGTLLGVSAAYLGSGLAPHRLITIERGPARARRAREFLDSLSLRDAVQVEVADFGDTARMASIIQGRRFGLIYKDGAHDGPATEAFLRNCVEWAQPGAIVLLDDVDRPDLADAWNLATEILDVAFLMTTGKTGIAALQ